MQARDHVQDFGIARLRIARENVGIVVRTFWENMSPSPTVRRQTNFCVARVKWVDQGTARTKQVFLNGLVVETEKTIKNVCVNKSHEIFSLLKSP